jgi:alkylation response protein AidB-like acyl-CoA dehydrogenase
MSQPDDYGFGEEAALLKDSAARFFSSRLPVDALHALVAGDHDPHRAREAAWREDCWGEMVELGWTALAVPEADGGLGLPLVAVAGLMEEVGRAAFPSPLLGTLACSYILAQANTDAARAAIGDILAGRSAAAALCAASGELSGTTAGVCYRGDVLEGCAYFVQDLQKAERFLVRADGDHGPRLFWLEREATGLSLEPDAIVDLTRDQGRLVLAGASAVPVCETADTAVEAALPALWTLVAADIAGAAEWLLQTTADYARTRQQFDRPIGFFQAVKHPLADLMVRVDGTRSLVYSAACAMDHEPARARELAHMAKASAADTAAFSASRAVQLHGGIGFTWESYLHLYFKRQLHSERLWGDGLWHRAQLADRYLGSRADR